MNLDRHRQAHAEIVENPQARQQALPAIADERAGT
jgi:hypothetical protein